MNIQIPKPIDSNCQYKVPKTLNTLRLSCYRWLVFP